VPIIVFLGAGVITFLGAIGKLPASPEWSNWLVFSTFFLAGSFVPATQAFANLISAISALSVVSLVFAVVGKHLPAWELVLTAFVIMIGCLKLPMRLRLPIDISYGVYLYAFPVQQLSAMLFNDFWVALTFSALLTLALALMSALFIESYALSFRTELQHSRWPKELLVKYITRGQDPSGKAEGDRLI
jgi:peptidoglycan/LPS O-acetylase OafA/YrhL